MSNIKEMQRVKIEAAILYLVAITIFILPLDFYIRVSGCMLSFLGFFVALHMVFGIEDTLADRERSIKRRLDRLFVPRVEHVVIEKDPPLILTID